MSKIVLHEGDCFENLKLIPDQSVDSIVTDPPYAISFMGKKWDYDLPSVELWVECLRILKPGGHMLAFGGTRTYHRLVCAIEDAGFEIRDQIGWCFGSGFPKSHDISKAIDRAAGADREVVGVRPGHEDFINRTDAHSAGTRREGWDRPWKSDAAAVLAHHQQTAPATDAARQWNGFGTALKPAWEPIVLARRPLIGTVVKNVLTHGTGGINIDGCRVNIKPDDDIYAKNPHTLGTIGANGIYSAGVATMYLVPRPNGRDGEPSQNRRYTDNGSTNFAATPGPRGGAPAGRWPANLIHDGSPEVEAAFAAFGHAGGGYGTAGGKQEHAAFGGGMKNRGNEIGFGDTGTASRFFYSAKASKRDRAGSRHPTVKPLSLMRYLCRLVTPLGGTVCDPFSGSGTTGQAAAEEGFDAILMEREPEYIEDIKRRCAPWMKKKPLWWPARSAMNFPQRRNKQTETIPLAEITIKINVNKETDRDHVAQWLEMALALDTTQVTATPTAPSVQAVARTGNGIDTDEQGSDDDADTDEDEQPVVGAGLPAPRRRGRRSNAEKAAEREALEKAAVAATQPATPAPAAARPASAALPPGITMPGAQTGPAAAQVSVMQPSTMMGQTATAQATPVAMPHAGGADPVTTTANGSMTLEDFREGMRQLHTLKQGFPSLVMRGGKWSDGSVKPVWFTMESVPDAYRERLIGEVQQQLESQGVSTL